MIEVTVPPGTLASELDELRKAIRAHPGRVRVCLHVDQRRIMLGRHYGVDGSAEALLALMDAVHGPVVES